MSLKGIVPRVCLSSLISGLAAATAAAQDAVYTQGHFTFEAGTAGFRVPVEARVIKGAPFSADIVTESTQTLSDGNRIVERSTTRFYRDSAGRVRREEDRGAGSPAVSISDPVAGTTYLLDSETRTAQRTPNMMAINLTTAAQKVRTLYFQNSIAIAHAPFEVSRTPEDVRVQTLPERTIEGVRAEGIRRTSIIAARSIGNELPIESVSEEWTSPDLKVLVLTEHRDPRMGTSTYRVTNINRAEPDAYLFEVPADYTVQQNDRLKKISPVGR